MRILCNAGKFSAEQILDRLIKVRNSKKNLQGFSIWL